MIVQDGTVTFLMRREELASNVSPQFLGSTRPSIFKDSYLLVTPTTTYASNA